MDRGGWIDAVCGAVALVLVVLGIVWGVPLLGIVFAQ